MKSKKKKRLLILIGILIVCLLPISFLSKVLVPWAEELGGVTTEAGAAPPGDATVTDAVTDEKEGQLVNISDPILSWKEVQLLYAPQPHQETQFPHIHDFYYGRFYKTSSDYVQATLYCIAINASDKAYATHGYCYQHGVSTDNYGTVLSAVDGHSQFTSQDSYTNIAKALAYAKHWTPMPGVVWNGFTSDGGDNEHTKNDNAVVALACSYFSGASEETSKASTIYGYGTGYYGNSPRAYIDALNAISYKDLPFLVDGVNGVSKGKRCGVTGRTKADKSEDGLLMSDVLTVDASSDLVWNYAIPANYKFRVYTNAELTQYTDYNAGSTVSLRGGSKFRVYANPIVGNKTVTFDFGNNTKYIMYLTCWLSPGGYQNVVTGDLSFSPFSFQLEWEGTSHVALKKSSSNPNCSNNNPLYDLAGTTYTLYTDVNATNVAKTVSGSNAVLTCNSAGNTNTLEMPIGTYYAKETKAGKGYLKSDQILGPFILTASNTMDNPYVINATDTPVDDPITVALTKSTNSNKPIRGAVYCIEYYPGIQTYSESDAQTKHTGSVSKWYFETDAKGKVRFASSPIASGYNSSPFFTGVLGERTIPLGTVIMYEEKAPANYTKSSTHWVFQVRQSGDGQRAWLYGLDKNGVEQQYDSTTVSDTNAPNFTESPIHVRLPLVKAYTDKNPHQGDYGDTSVAGAVFALYAERDIVDVSTGETVVRAETYTADTPLKFDDGTPVTDPTTGKQVIAKAGTPKVIKISAPTDKDGKTEMNNIFPAKKADDYYVMEICAPKDFYKDTTKHPQDLRDGRTDQQKLTVNYDEYTAKTFTISNRTIEQPIHVKKYVPVKDGNTTKIEPLNGAGFSVYLISSLKGDISACKVTNADGSVSYNFKSYDFSNETGEVVTDDGERVLVTGSGDNDDGEVTSIDLMPGTYVIVETKTPEGYETVDPMVVTLPRYRKDANGDIVKDNNDDPRIYATTSVSPTDGPIEKYLKINKKDKSTSEFVFQNRAKFSIWNISGTDTSEYSKDPKTYGKQVTQQRQTETGYTDVSTFETNDEGYLMLFEPFKYGEYAIVEEEAPVGFDKAEPIIFSVRQDGVYLWVNNSWEKAAVYTNATGETEYEYWEVDFYDAPFSLEVAKADWETGKWVPNAELTIYKALDKAGHVALDESGNPVILEARDESGKTVKAVWVTSAGIKRFDKVPAGWYVIRETKAPTEDGYATCADKVVYVGNDETIAPGGKMTISGDETVYYSFSYDKDGVIIANVAEYEYNTKNGKVALYDKPITVEISKIDAATEKELAGAVLTLYRVDEDEDTVIETWTSTKTSHVVKYLTPGRYKLHEDTVPLGYYTTQNTIEFDVSNTEEIQKCVMVNHPIEVTFDKQSINLGGTSLPGATLALYRVSEGPAFATATDATASDASSSDATVSDASNSDADGLQLVERWVTDGKPHTIKYLTPGDYRLIEEKTPEGYTTAASIDFSVSDQKAAEAVVMYDEPIKCYVQIFKHGEMLTKTEIVECEYGKYTKFKWEDAPMSQVSFDVYDEDGNLVDTIVTNENGTGISKELAFGSYKIKERVPDGWVDNHVVYNVKFTWLQGMTETNLTASVTVNNESCNTQININKVGEEAVLNSKGEYEYVEKPLKGVLFGVYAKDAIKDYSGKEIAAADTCVGYAVTDSNGVASCDSKLVRGEYYYKELKTAGPQYVMDEDLHPFTLILANSKISTFNVNETLPIKNVLARGNIKVLKVNKDGRAPLAGAEFDVFNADGKIVDHLVTGADGTAMTKVLPYGKYSLRETKAPTGFVLSKAAFDTEIIANGDVPLLEITNSTITKLGSKGIFIVVGLAVIFAGLVTVICFKLRRK